MANNKEIKIYKDAQELAESFAFELFQMTQSNRQRFDIALSGGSTPKLLFDVLASEYAEKFPWERIHFWWGDERCVPPTDADSNYGMTKQHLFSKITIAENQIHRVKGELDPAKAAALYSDEIKSQLNDRDGWPNFDLIILGMGDDGHTASIFPHEMQLLNSDKICEVATHPVSGQKRVSLTGKVLNNANRVHFLISGQAKAQRLAEIMSDSADAKKLPSYHIEPVQGETIFFLDEEAASKLP